MIINTHDTDRRLTIILLSNIILLLNRLLLVLLLIECCHAKVLMIKIGLILIVHGLI